MVKYIAILMMVSVAGLIGCAGSDLEKSEAEAVKNNEPAIVLVAFGTSVDKARKVFDHIDAAAKKRYPGRKIHWAFTSGFIRKKLAERGVETFSPEQIVGQLKRAGYKRAVFQSLHIAPGQEFKSVADIDKQGLEIAVGKALLSSDEDIARTIRAIEKDICQDAVNVVACHGNDRYPEFNKQLIVFTKMIETRHRNVLVCSVEGQPGVASLQKAKTQAKIMGKVKFIPLMIVAGDHIMNDVMGDEEDAWKVIVGASENSCAKPLGYNDAVLAIFFDHLDEAMRTLK